ncbi:MAG: hypothetical protein LBR98_09390 [Syntrophomonadaceae bacterium]|jgi:hypothetical protein|nr:hypothetical protein [Syntrophomonadaceae bacterium]
MRTLVATLLENNKKGKIYCAARKVDDLHIELIKSIDRKILTENGFTFIRMISLEYPNISGYAIFFEGHLDQMARILKEIKSRSGL